LLKFATINRKNIICFILFFILLLNPLILDAEIYYISGNQNVYTDNDLSNVYNKLPQSVKNIKPIFYIVQTDYVYNNESLIAFSTCYKNKITLYRNVDCIGDWDKQSQLRQLKRTILHECGHMLAYRQNIHMDFWQQIMDIENKYVNNWGNFKSPDEDFAETFVYYFQSVDKLKEEFPIRYHVIKKIIQKNDVERYR